MSHLQSETIQDPSGKWVNVFGRNTANAGSQLPGTSTYKTLPEAEAVAVQKSKESPEEKELTPLAVQRFWERTYTPPVKEAKPSAGASPSVSANSSLLWELQKKFGPPSEMEMFGPNGLTQRDLDHLDGLLKEFSAPKPVKEAPRSESPSRLQRLSQAFQDYMKRKTDEASRLTKGPFHQKGGIDVAAGGASGLSNPVGAPIVGLVGNPESSVAKLTQKLMPKVYKYIEQYPDIKVFFDWLPNHVSKPTDQILGTTFAQPAKQAIKVEALHPYNMYKQLQLLSPEAQAQYLRFYKSTIPHELKHTLDILKQHRLTGVLANMGKLTGEKSKAAAERLMAADEGLKDLFHGSLTHYFSVMKKVGMSNADAMNVAHDLALNEVAVQAGADTAAKQALKGMKKAAEKP